MQRFLSIPFVAAVTVAWNVVMTFVAIAIDAPSQFGITGTDPAEEWMQSGTAISAPPLPLILLIVGAVLATRSGVLRIAGRVLVLVTAALFAIGGIGELVGDPNSHTSQGELIFGGIVALIFAAWLVAAVVADVRARRASLAAA